MSRRFRLVPDRVNHGRNIGLVSGPGAVAVLACSAEAWGQRAWGLAAWLHYTLVAVAALYVVWYLNEVNLLGLQF